MTIEGFGDDRIMSALRAAFHQHHALQCGFCTPGMLITARDIIRRNRAGSEQEIRKELAGNICRCTGYTNIVTAIGAAASVLAAERSTAPAGPGGFDMKHQASGTASGVGASLLRKEDARHLHGRGQFVADVKLPGTRDVAFVRSPHAHARIKSIAVPPEAAGQVFTARDLPRLTEMRAVPQVNGFKVSGYPPLATQKVRYVGEPIAACIAPTRAEAEDLANSVSVEFEVLPAVVDAAAAVSKPPSLVHESWTNNLFIERMFAAAISRRSRAQPMWWCAAASA